MLEKRLFSEYYHNLIDNKPPAVAEQTAKPPVTVTSATLKSATTATSTPTIVSTGTTTVATTSTSTQTAVVAPVVAPPAPINNEIGRVIVEQPLHLNMNVQTLAGSTVGYVTLLQNTAINSIDIYFDKATSLMSRFKLRLRVYEARNNEGKLQTRLLYHQCFDEDLSVQLINYGHSSQSEVYKSSSNVLTLRNLKATTRHLVVEADFTFVTLRLTKKSKDLAQQINIIPIVKGETVDELPVDIAGFTTRKDQ